MKTFDFIKEYISEVVCTKKFLYLCLFWEIIPSILLLLGYTEGWKVIYKVLIFASPALLVVLVPILFPIVAFIIVRMSPDIKDIEEATEEEH